VQTKTSIDGDRILRDARTDRAVKRNRARKYRLQWRLLERQRHKKQGYIVVIVPVAADA